MSRNSYLSSVTHVPRSLDLAQATVDGISIDGADFEFTLLRGDVIADQTPRLLISSMTRHHEVAPVRLDGTESPSDLLKLALAMARVAIMEDLAYRFKFHGSPIFARGVE